MYNSYPLLTRELNKNIEDDCQFMRKAVCINPLVPKLFGRAQKNLIFYRGIEHYGFIFLTRCWLGKPHSNHYH